MVESVHKSKYTACINGPILFTAPHSGKLKRGGFEEYDEKRRTHLREAYASYIAIKFALEASFKTSADEPQRGAFCIWSKEHKLNEVDLDPNYLT